MQDPNDPGTLCLIEACKRPLTAAQRQERLRKKRRAERLAGRRIPLGDVTLAELQELKAAVGSVWDDAIGPRGELLAGLWKRLDAAERRALGPDQ